MYIYSFSPLYLRLHFPVYPHHVTTHSHLSIYTYIKSTFIAPSDASNMAGSVISPKIAFDFWLTGQLCPSHFISIKKKHVGPIQNKHLPLPLGPDPATIVDRKGFRWSATRQEWVLRNEGPPIITEAKLSDTLAGIMRGADKKTGRSYSSLCTAKVLLLFVPT